MVQNKNKLNLMNVFRVMVEVFMKFWSVFKNWLINIGQDHFEYVDLAPTDKADKSGIYSDALIFATKNRNVSNIALTGPYGSGKSSIIKTFLKRYRKYWFLKKPVLQISLAAFLPEADDSNFDQENSIQVAKQKKGNVSKQEIERSILQQMLYGADANSLPLSRFKRIQSPKWWFRLVSLFFILGIAACWHLIQERAKVLDGSFFQPLDHTNWFNLTFFFVGFLFIWQVLHHIYIKSFGVSLKSISLKDIEITPEAATEESILNRHLDEIIYFFQSTKYDLVIIEDLDRFNNPDIFVTLREINSLVNANAGVKRQIRFLYALRDNMFVNTDRTKFFEFIVPVIPIINSLNSIDKVLEQGQRLSLDERLDRQFIREVSRYLNDLRLIQNVFNEYVVYIKNLEPDEENNLDENKLLSVLIYKNLLPSDFEALHQGKGKLAGVLNQYDKLIANVEVHNKAQISKLEQQIIDAEKQVPSDLEELRKIYAMALISKIPEHNTMFEFGGKNDHSIKTICDHEEFEQILEAEEIVCRSGQGHHDRVKLVGLEDSIDPNKTYRQRKEEIEHKSAQSREAKAEKINELRTEISNLRTAKFNEVIRIDAKATEQLFDAFGENREVVRFLVFEGFLDDTYYQYTSLFHSGRLSPNDHKFLIQIRAFNNPEPDFQIDNAAEVIASMRDDDFLQNYILNTILVDRLFSDPEEYKEQIEKLIEFISLNFGECEAFFSNYYATGKSLPKFLTALFDRWPEYVTSALASTNSVTHIARIIAHFPEAFLAKIQKKDANFTDFISTRLSEVLAKEIDFDPERLKLLPLKTLNLHSLAEHKAITRLIIDEGLYEISIENIEFILRNETSLPDLNDLEVKHYSTVLKSGEIALIDKIEDDFDHYLKNILLALETNTEEDISAITKAISHDEIENEHLVAYVEQQTAKFSSLLEVPARFFVSFFELKRIVPSWENCLAFITSDYFDAEKLTAFLQEDDAQDILSSVKINEDKDTFPLREFLINNNDLAVDTYRAYVKMLPKQFIQFPDVIDEDNLIILIEEQKISFSESTFSHLNEYYEFQVIFVANNIESYFENKDQIVIDDEFREQLLNSNIGDAHKLRVIEDMDLSLLVSLPARAKVIGELYHRTDTGLSHLSSEIAKALITNTRPIAAQVSLLNKCQEALTDDQVRQTLQTLSDPFPDIKPSWLSPRLPKTEINIELVEWLDKREIISSWGDSIWGDIKINNRRS